MGFSELPVFAAAAAGVAKLPVHHRDPFDRLLVAQALSEPARLLTADPTLVPYTELVWLFTASAGGAKHPSHRASINSRLVYGCRPGVRPQASNS